MTTLAIPIEEKIQVELTQYAKEQNVSIDELIKRFVEQLLFEQRMASIRRRMKPFIEQSGYKNEDDILNDIS